MLGGMAAAPRRRFPRRTALFAGGVFSSVAGGRRADGGTARAGRTPDRRSLERLRGAIAGRLVVPDDEGYDAARRVFYWNERLATRPLAIVRCGVEDDAARAVEFARRHDLEIAVRAGGHAHLAWGGSNGLVIDLSPLTRIAVDPRRRVVHAQAGALSGAVARAAAPHGLVPVLGQCPAVGATGVILGGGLGWLAGLFGACCDNLVAARVVTSDGRAVAVDANRAEDLWWGLRGAGANFGVTTSLTARLHPLGPVLGGDVHYAVADARAVLRGFRDLMERAPDSLQATLNLTRGPRGLFVSLCETGGSAAADRTLDALRAIARPTREAVQWQPYADLAEKAAATAPGNAPATAGRMIETVYRRRMDDDLIDIVVDRLAAASPDTILGLSHFMHGAVCRVAPTATAFPHRDAGAVHLRLASSWSDPREAAGRFAEGEQWRALLRPVADEGIYANYQTYAAPAGAKAIFGPNHARLAALKAVHDPDNVFRRNANVPPAAV